MNKINFKILIITCIMCLVPIIFGIVFYDSLPDEIAIHFDVNNNPDNYASKDFCVFGIPIIMMFIQVFCSITTDIRDENPEANRKAISVIKWIIPTLTVMVYIVTLMYAMNIILEIHRIVFLVLGAMFILIGNYMPKFVGTNSLNIHLHPIKIKDEKLNNTVKRKAGYMLIINGFLFMLSVLFGTIVSISILLLFIIESFVLYIYVLVKNKSK